MTQFDVEVKRRPPYVEFYDEAVPDVEASKAAGHQVMKSVDFVLVRPLGSKDDFRQEVTLWFQQLEAQARNGQIESGWVKIYKNMYKEYQAEGHTPVNGMPVEQWAQINKGQSLNLRAMGCRTVEDLAEWPDGNLSNLGMGARALRESAIAWLKSSEKGKAAAEIEKLTVQNKDREATIAKLMLRLEKLEQKLEAAEDSKD